MILKHTACYPGKKVKVVLRDGTVLIDKFVDRKSKWIVLKNYGKVYKEEIKVFSIFNIKIASRQHGI